MKRIVLLLAVALAACQQAKTVNQTVKEPMDGCALMTPHSAATDCKASVAKRSQAEVERAYQQALVKAGKLDAEDRQAFPSQPPAKFRERLEAAQADWMQLVDRQCTIERDTSFGGSGGWDFEPECRHRMSLSRLNDLKAILKLTARLDERN